MSQRKRVGSLEISEDIQFQRKEWTVERAGWAIMAAIILLALTGLFGSGPISTATQSSPQGFEITYERLDRQKSPMVILEDGKLIKERMDKARVDESDILAKARELQGLERLDQIKYAVLERSGGVTIIPKER